VRARPFSVFGRPVHHSGLLPLITTRWFSSSLSDPASRRAPCPPGSRRWWLQVGLSVSRLSPSCLTSLSIPFHPSRPMRNYPHLRISARGLGLSGTQTHLTRQLSGTHHDPVRHPPAPPPRATSGPQPPYERVSPGYPYHPSDVPCPLPRWTTAGACVGCFPAARGLPRFSAGSTPTSSLSRPAQASLTLRPARSLSRPRRPSSRGFSPHDCSSKPLVSYQINRQLSGWNLPPLVIRAAWAH